MSSDDLSKVRWSTILLGELLELYYIYCTECRLLCSIAAVRGHRRYVRDKYLTAVLALAAVEVAVHHELTLAAELLATLAARER